MPGDRKRQQVRTKSWNTAVVVGCGRHLCPQPSIAGCSLLPSPGGTSAPPDPLTVTRRWNGSPAVMLLLGGSSSEHRLPPKPRAEVLVSEDGRASVHTGPEWLMSRAPCCPADMKWERGLNVCCFKPWGFGAVHWPQHSLIAWWVLTNTLIRFLCSLLSLVSVRPLKRLRNETLDVSDGKSMAEKKRGLFEVVSWEKLDSKSLLQPMPPDYHSPLASIEGRRLTIKKSWTREVLELGTLATAESGC